MHFIGSTPNVVIGVEQTIPKHNNGKCINKLIHEQVHYDLRIGSWFRFPPFELEG